jgi:hypothetical protein
MKEHPILFSTEMVKAILEGRKTQTRRVITPQPNHDVSSDLIRSHLTCRLGESGDRLWVRETFMLFPKVGGGIDHIHYKADYPTDTVYWQPAIFMPRKYSRITLEIIDTKVEQIENITELDAIAEGIKNMGTMPYHAFLNICKAPAIHEYAILWDSINAKRGYSWAKNPWVWVIEFKVNSAGVTGRE